MLRLMVHSLTSKAAKRTVRVLDDASHLLRGQVEGGYTAAKWLGTAVREARVCIRLVNLEALRALDAPDLGANLELGRAPSWLGVSKNDLAPALVSRSSSVSIALVSWAGRAWARSRGRRTRGWTRGWTGRWTRRWSRRAAACTELAARDTSLHDTAVGVSRTVAVREATDTDWNSSAASLATLNRHWQLSWTTVHAILWWVRVLGRSSR